MSEAGNTLLKHKKKIGMQSNIYLFECTTHVSSSSLLWSGIINKDCFVFVSLNVFDMFKLYCLWLQLYKNDITITKNNNINKLIKNRIIINKYNNNNNKPKSIFHRAKTIQNKQWTHTYTCSTDNTHINSYQEPVFPNSSP